MTLVKGAVCAAIGAAVGAAVWFFAIKLSGWNLWVLAPIVGGAAGFGMMRGTQMKGGLPAGAIAAVMTLGAVFGARWAVVSQYADEAAAVSEADAVALLEDEAAAAQERRGVESREEDGEYTYVVRSRAWQNWSGMSEYERQQYRKRKEAENARVIGAFKPLGLLFDFGIFGTVCAVLAAGTAFKTGSATLEGELSKRGLSDAEVEAESARMRAEDGGSAAGRWGLPVRVEDKKVAVQGEVKKPAA